MKNLLPPNQTTFEQHLLDVTAQNVSLPVPLKSLSNIDQAPDQFLPFLGWQYSVDSWNNNWSPTIQRNLIKQSFHQHQIKGTRSAVRHVLEQFGYSCTFTEWFEMSPQGAAGTFELSLELNGRELTEEIFNEAQRLIQDAKPKSRHLLSLKVQVQPMCKAGMVTAHHQFVSTTVAPLETPIVGVSGSIAAHHLSTFVTIFSRD